VTDLATFASFEGIEDHATLVGGRWAAPGASPLEATLSEAAAAALGVRTGDRLSLASRLTPSRTVDVAITGTWGLDPADAYWLADPLVLAGSEESGRFTTRGPLVVAEADLVEGLAESLDAQWRAIPDVAGFRPDTLDAGAPTSPASRAGQRGAAGLEPGVGGGQAAHILASVDRSVLVPRRASCCCSCSSACSPRTP
jgi:hypothetical protein